MLSSGGVRHPVIRNEFLKVIAKNPKGMKLAFITTAYKFDVSNDFAVEDKKQLEEWGFNIVELDLYTKAKEEIEIILSDVEIIYVEGGNAYVLLDAINKSGFAEILKNKLNDEVLYFGTSAGAYVACPTIEMCGWSGDRPNIPGIEDFTAMNLVPFILSVHYNRPTHNNIRVSVLNCKLPVKVLRDNQALLIDDEQTVLLGEGEEVIIN